MAADNRVKYYWTPDHSLSIDEFIKKYRPSVFTTADAPWIWVSNGQKIEDPEERDESLAVGKGMSVMDGLEKRLKEIDADDSIPARAKSGVKGKKGWKDEALKEATAALKKISVDANWTCGKWLLFPSPDSVDGIWAAVARSVANGPLKEAGVDTAKVATSAGDERPHLICMYFANVYDEDLARKILKAMILEHGIESRSCKSDLYTVVGIDSKHPTKLRSSIYQSTELLSVDEIKDLKAQHEKNKKSGKKESVRFHEPAAKDGSEAAKKDEGATNGAGSENPDTPEKAGGKRTADTVADEPRVKRVKSEAQRFKDNDIFAGSDDDSDDD